MTNLKIWRIKSRLLGISFEIYTTHVMFEIISSLIKSLPTNITIIIVLFIICQLCVKCVDSFVKLSGINSVEETLWTFENGWFINLWICRSCWINATLSWICWGAFILLLSIWSWILWSITFLMTLFLFVMDAYWRKCNAFDKIGCKIFRNQTTGIKMSALIKSYIKASDCKIWDEIEKMSMNRP